MELRQLEHFVAVAEERHFTRAARRVHLGQSSLSGSIQALERELGSTLLTRSSRQVLLTAAGSAFLPAARRALGAVDDARAVVDEVAGLVRGQLAIGVIQTLGSLDLSALLARYHERHPHVILTLRNDSVPALVQATIGGELDVAFVDRQLDDRRVHATSLGTETLVLAVRRDDPLASRHTVALTDLTERDFVEYRADSALRARIDAGCAEVGLRRRIRCQTDTIASLVDLVAHGLGVALLPPQTISDTDQLRAVDTDPGITRELALVTPADLPSAPAADALLHLLDERLDRDLGGLYSARNAR